MNSDVHSTMLNRELSWLDFDTRVLALAERADLPLLDRLRFVCISYRNLDEFFQVRIAGVKNQVNDGLTELSADGRTPAEQLAAIVPSAFKLAGRIDRHFATVMRPALVEESITLCDPDELSDDDHKYLLAEFEARVFPVLTPLSVDPGHPFPHISDLSLNLAVRVLDVATGDERFARVKVPPLLPRLIPLPDRVRFVFIEDMIAIHLPALFPGMEIAGHWTFRVTRGVDAVRDGDDDDDDDVDDLLEAIEMELSRRRFTPAVRLQVEASMPPDVLALLLDELELAPEDVSKHEGHLALADMAQLCDLDRPDLKDEVIASVTPTRFTAAASGGDIFAEIRERDILVHHPYESFTTTFEAFLDQAARDPKVLAIKQTLYRTAGDSHVVDSLIAAAEAGKQVAVLVELKARFDERANITWARVLERAGVHVVYGLVGLKTHAKACLVVRDDDDRLRRYCHLGTGNYNHRTARQYDDIGLFTCDANIADDLTHLFNYLTGFSKEANYRRLLVAPRNLRNELISMIHQEMNAPGGTGKITLKINSLSDTILIAALYEASNAGVEVDLIVRGVCCLRPGVPGLSENIRVRSIVGRYLEHSRIFVFANGRAPGVPAYYIGSADMMRRNLDRRVEILTPIDSPELQLRLQSIINLAKADDALAWELDQYGLWQKVPQVSGLDTQLALHYLVRRI